MELKNTDEKLISLLIYEVVEPVQPVKSVSFKSNSVSLQESTLCDTRIVYITCDPLAKIKHTEFLSHKIMEKIWCLSNVKAVDECLL